MPWGKLSGAIAPSSGVISPSEQSYLADSGSTLYCSPLGSRMLALPLRATYIAPDEQFLAAVAWRY
jgi:hypothetical protein